MRIEIRSVHHRGNRGKEYVSLKANADCDAGAYILADSTCRSDGEITGSLRRTFWLPSRRIAKGDYIHVYTSAGANTSFTNRSRSTTHIVYWGLSDAIWKDDTSCAVLFDIGAWQYCPVQMPSLGAPLLT